MVVSRGAALRALPGCPLLVGPPAGTALATPRARGSALWRPPTACHRAAAAQSPAPACAPALQVAASMRAALPPAVAAALVPLGSVPLRCCPGEPEELWSLPGLYPARLAPPSPTAAPPKSLSKSPRAADTAGAAC